MVLPTQVLQILYGRGRYFSWAWPVRIGFTVRNDSNFAVESGDNFTAQVVLSKDDFFNTEDFILREFDLGGNALGAQLLPNETIRLDWIQQMPDNLEGDYYLLLHITETGQDFRLQNTPVVTLNSKNRRDCCN